MGGPGGALATLLLVVQTASAQPGTNRSSYACNHTAGVCVQQAGGPFSTLDQCLNDEACRAPSPPTPSPDVLPAACDLQFAPDGSTQGCSCDGYDLSLAKGQVVRTGVDSDGYTFLFSVCAESDSVTACVLLWSHPFIQCFPVRIGCGRSATRK